MGPANSASVLASSPDDRLTSNWNAAMTKVQGYLRWRDPALGQVIDNLPDNPVFVYLLREVRGRTDRTRSQLTDGGLPRPVYTSHNAMLKSEEVSANLREMIATSPLSSTDFHDAIYCISITPDPLIESFGDKRAKNWWDRLWAFGVSRIRLPIPILHFLAAMLIILTVSVAILVFPTGRMVSLRFRELYIELLWSFFASPYFISMCLLAGGFTFLNWAFWGMLSDRARSYMQVDFQRRLGGRISWWTPWSVCGVPEFIAGSLALIVVAPMFLVWFVIIARTGSGVQHQIAGIAGIPKVYMLLSLFFLYNLIWYSVLTWLTYRGRRDRLYAREASDEWRLTLMDTDRPVESAHVGGGVALPIDKASWLKRLRELVSTS